MHPTHPPIRLALVGAGIFMRDAHVPSLLHLREDFEIVAVYSRSETSAAQLVQQLGIPARIYTDYATLLAAPDIDAVDIVLPIPSMALYVMQALASGKHVISEKPIAMDSATARTLIDTHQQQHGQVWMVAENWRYESAFVQAAELVRGGAIGTPLTCHWAIYAPNLPGSKYYGSAWREAGLVPGGYILDGGVHHVAALRLILGDLAEVSATLTQVAPYLPPADTISAYVRFQNGVIGTYFAGYGVAAPWPPYLYIVGDGGAIRIQRGEIEVNCGGTSEVIHPAKFDGVEKELAAFAAATREGVSHLNTPEEAYQDVVVIEALLQSAQSGRSIAV
jgi:predicted dehydrogenase